jgi:hypothetical protein
MKEFLKVSKTPHSIKTSETYFTTVAIKKLAEASQLFSVTIGETRLFAVIEVPREILGLKVLGDLNREFERLVGGLSFIDAYILAASLLVNAIQKCRQARARLVLMYDNYFTSLPLQVENLCRGRQFASFYIDLVRNKSDFVDTVASALLIYIQTGRISPLYDIIRNMAQTKRLKPAEAKALYELVEHEAGD